MRRSYGRTFSSCYLYYPHSVYLMQMTTCLRQNFAIPIMYGSASMYVCRFNIYFGINYPIGLMAFNCMRVRYCRLAYNNERTQKGIFDFPIRMRISEWGVCLHVFRKRVESQS